ncbi:plasma membrane-associated cation-binding protein 1-like [Nicotiana tabacum]|uniref:Plasma Membrane-associated cation-binding protein 1-like n=2 Tax=Nicotiana TaxID=4085 RepID=O49911_TOBAC|nr:plasma membrane-associated cation-binding protein 1-like [Nicotiana tabacum]XP_009764366.1 PREDICTED: plasma membrane-associated cation-binding protein 1-like [Nicotiana sylvestris]CAA69901.1 plasma membrane polypeptide [Nicotiana tabacum]
MGYWQAKVVPKFKQIFDKNGPKKAAAAEACKTFDEAKEQYSKEFEEKKTELQPKVVEIYEAAAVEIKTLVKGPKVSGLKKHSTQVQKFLDELVKIEFPGSKAVSEASSNFGPSYVSGPVLFVFEKVSTFIVTEDKKEEEAAASEAEATTAAPVEVKEKEIVVEAEAKKEEEPAPAPAATPAAEVAPAEVAPAADVAPAKVEEAPAAVAAPEPPKA